MLWKTERTQSRDSTDESHGNRQIDVSSQQDAPKVGTSSTWAGTQNKQSKAEEFVGGQDPSDGVRKLQKRNGMRDMYDVYRPRKRQAWIWW